MNSSGAPVSAAAAVMSAAPAAASHGSLTSATFWSCDADMPMETQTAAPVFTTEYCVTLPSPCHHGPGPCHATYTVTEECTGDRDSWTQPTGVVPPGFVVTTVTDCNACPGGPTQTFTVPANGGPAGPTGVVPAPGPGPQPTMTSVVVTVPSQTGGQMPIQTAGAPPARTMSLKTSVGLLVGAALALFNFA